MVTKQHQGPSELEQVSLQPGHRQPSAHRDVIGHDAGHQCHMCAVYVVWQQSKSHLVKIALGFLFVFCFSFSEIVAWLVFLFLTVFLQ